MPKIDEEARGSILKSEEDEVPLEARESLALPRHPGMRALRHWRQRHSKGQSDHVDADEDGKETETCAYGGMMRKKPYQKHFCIGFPRERYIVLSPDNKFSWYQDYDSYESGQKPFGSIDITTSTKIELVIHGHHNTTGNDDNNNSNSSSSMDINNSYLAVTPSPGIKALEILSLDQATKNEYWAQILQGRVKILRHRNLLNMHLGTTTITILCYASLIEGKALIQAFLSQQSGDIHKSLRIIVKDESEEEELLDFIQDDKMNFDQEKRKKTSVIPVNVENVDILKNILQGQTDIAIITRPDLDWKERETILKNYITALEASEIAFTILTSSIMAALPTSSEGKVLSKVEEMIVDSDLSYTILRLPLLMETFLNFTDTIQENGNLSLPVSNDVEFTVLSVDDYATAVVHLLSRLKRHAGKKYRLTAPLVTFVDFMNIIEGYTNKNIEFDRISFDDFATKNISKGFMRWTMTEQKEYFELVDNLSLIVSDQTNDFTDITGGIHAEGIANWIEKHRKSIISEDDTIEESAIRPSIQLKRNSSRRKTDDQFGIRRGSGRHFVQGA